MPNYLIRTAIAGVFLVGTWPDTAFVAPQTSVASAQEAGQGAYSSDELASILSPIALYQDELLTQTLMASTYPGDIAAAMGWLNEGNNKSLKGEDLENALRSKPWDPSVKSLTPFPQVLEQLSTHVDWTKELAYAMSVQPSEVMVAVQKLRAQAKESGHLKSSAELKVTTQPTPAPAPGAPPPPADMPNTTIVIEPANPNVVYVPAYDPHVVYGGWRYEYPPYYWPPPYGYYPGAALAAGIAFGVGLAAIGGYWGWAHPGWGWGGSFVNVNVNRYNNISGGNRWNGGGNGAWRPSNRPGGPGNRPGGPGNRQGGPGNRPGGPGNRPNHGQGRPSQPIGRPPAASRPGGERPGQGVGQRPGQGIGQRPGVGQGGAQRPGVGQGRPSQPIARPPAASRPGGARPGQGVGQRPGQGIGQRPGMGQGVGQRPSVGQGAGRGSSVGQAGRGSSFGGGRSGGRSGGGGHHRSRRR